MKRKRLLLIVAMCAVGVPVAGLSLMSWFSKPPDNLGVTNGRLTDCPQTPNCVCTQADDTDHRMDPIPLTGTAGEMAQRIVAAIGSMPRTQIVRQDDHYIRAEFRSAVFRFTDDVEFLIDDENQLVHFRSASRVGHSDMGANRKRMEALVERLKAST